MSELGLQLRRRLEVLSQERSALELRLAENGAARREVETLLRTLETPSTANPVQLQTEEGSDYTATASASNAQGSSRPTVRQLARDSANREGGEFRVRQLLELAQSHGHRSDHGGLHTALRGMAEFEHSGPGRFRLARP